MSDQHGGQEVSFSTTYKTLLCSSNFGKKVLVEQLKLYRDDSCLAPGVLDGILDLKKHIVVGATPQTPSA